MLENTYIVMPAYNAALTLAKTVDDIPAALRSRIIVVDDFSSDETVAIADALGLHVVRHSENLGYGANQKTCYRHAMTLGAEIIVMVHPDYQYDARMSEIMAQIIELGTCDFVLGNRIRTRKEALGGGMPKWKYFTNRFTTLVENFLLGQSIGDFHSGFRAYSREVLATIPFEENSNDFAFDQELIVQAVAFGFRLGDVPVPVRYFDDSSSIGLLRSIRYGFGGIRSILKYQMVRMHLATSKQFQRADSSRFRDAECES